MAGEEANDCKLEIISSTFRVRTVRVADSTKLAHVSIMQGRSGQKALPAIYTLYKVTLHNITCLEPTLTSTLKPVKNCIKIYKGSAFAQLFQFQDELLKVWTLP